MELSPQEIYVLKQLAEKKELKEEEMGNSEFSTENIRGAVSWLQKKNLVSLNIIEETLYSLTEEGYDFLKSGLPETEMIELLKAEGTLTLGEVFERLGKDRGKIALTQMAKFNVKPVSGNITLPPESGIDHELSIRKMVLEKLSKGSPIESEEESVQFQNLLKRSGIVDSKIRRTRFVSLTAEGKKALTELHEEKSVGNLANEMLITGEWKDVTFRSYDLNMPGKNTKRIGLHPMTILIEKVRQIYLSMGFTELKDDYVELSGWNMDALFIPQDHPARDMQDTFFLDFMDKEVSAEDEKLFKHVGKVHTHGMRGYSGWGYEWSMDEARKYLLRTHTTASTMRAFQKNPQAEMAVFSVDKVFRHESVDWKHLAEFYQMEGAIHSKNANLATLKWFMRKFYSKLGFDNIELIPSYYPYTEPSMDVIVQINGKEVEMGGSGVIRPEVTKSLGLKHNVIAWGLGLERLALMYYGLDDVRKLYNSDIDWLRSYTIKL